MSEQGSGLFQHNLYAWVDSYLPEYVMDLYLPKESVRDLNLLKKGVLDLYPPEKSVMDLYLPECVWV